jgi:hypothetical protein
MWAYGLGVHVCVYRIECSYIYMYLYLYCVLQEVILVKYSFATKSVPSKNA